jgi:hypothetical protein
MLRLAVVALALSLFGLAAYADTGPSPGALDQKRAELQRLCKDGCTIIPNRTFNEMLQALHSCATGEPIQKPN